MDPPLRPPVRHWRVVARDVVYETDSKRADDLLYELLTVIEDQILQVHPDPEPQPIAKPPAWVK